MTPCVVLFLLLLLIAVSGVRAAAQERTPARGGGPASTMEQRGGLAEAARMIAEQLTVAFSRMEGLVIGFDGDQVLIDRGTAEGVFQGMELDVFREGEEFRHPLTGELLGKLDKDLGRVRVLHVRERYSETKVIKKVGKDGFRKGDRVRLSMARIIAAFPNVDVEGISGVGTRSITKELASALARTERFELIDERQLRSILLTDQSLIAAELAQPSMLKQLAEKGRVQVLLLSRLTPSADGASLDVQAYSTLTGAQIVLVSTPLQVEITTRDQAPQSAPPTSSASPGTKTPHETGKPVLAAPPAPSKSPAPSMSSEHIELTPAPDSSMTAIAIADLDGDGKSELFLAGTKRLAVFRIDGSHLKPLAEYPLSKKGAVVTFEAMDVSGDGGAEIIMTLSHKDRVHALVIQWVGGKLESILEIPDLVLRPLPSGENSAQLFGQALEPGDRTAKPIHPYTWDGRHFYQGPAIDVPAGLLLVEIVARDLSWNGGVRMLTFKGGTTLNVHSQAGDIIRTYTTSREAMASINRVSPRILIEKKRDGEAPHLIVGREQEVGAGPLGRWTGSKATSVTVLKWDDTTFHEVREMPIPQGVLADYAVADLGEGLGRRLLALVVKSGRLGMGRKSEIRAFRLQ